MTTASTPPGIVLRLLVAGIPLDLGGVGVDGEDLIAAVPETLVDGVAAVAPGGRATR
jgi:hypothetical protein